MRDFLAIAKALSDASRVRILMFLRDGELCVCQVVEMLNLAPSTVSEHMAILHRAGLVEGRKDGRWMFYRLAGEDASEPVRQALSWLESSLAGDRQALDDMKQLKIIKRTPVKDLCRGYKAQKVHATGSSATKS
jgi:ArsR family transcriptional regulator